MLGHIAEVPDSTDIRAVDQMDLGEPLEDPPVREMKNIEALGLCAAIDLIDPRAECGGIAELLGYDFQHAGMIALREQISRQAPHAQVLLVEPGNLAT